MGKRFFQNDGDAVVFVGGVMVLPGQGRDVDEQFMPAGHVDAPAAADEPPPPDPDANLRELLAAPLKGITPQLTGFGDETLARLVQLEEAHETPRKTLLAAIGELQLERAQARAGGAPT